MDNDNTKLINMLIKDLGDKSSVIEINENEVKSNIIYMKIEYAIVFDKGFTKGMVQ